MANLTDTAARGGAIPAILDALNRTEAERRALVAQLADSEAAPSKVPDARDLRGTLHRYLDDWHSLAGGNVPETRRPLDSVLGGRIVFKPVRGDDGAPMYELQIPIAFDRLLVSIVPGLERIARVGLASPNGMAHFYTMTGAARRAA